MDSTRRSHLCLVTENTDPSLLTDTVGRARDLGAVLERLDSGSTELDPVLARVIIQLVRRISDDVRTLVAEAVA